MGRPYLVTLILFPALLQLIYFFFFFFFFFFFGKKGVLPGFEPGTSRSPSLDANRYATSAPTTTTTSKRLLN